MTEKKPEKLKVTYRPIAELIPYARNARTHSEEQVSRIAASIREYGWTNPILTDGASGIIAGHGRLAAARLLGLKEVPTIELAGMTETQKRAYILADNRLALDAGWDEEALKIELADLKAADFDLDLTGFSAEELDGYLRTDTEMVERYGENVGSGVLVDKFLVPPFSVLDTRQGYWQERARRWDKIIGDFGQSRDDTLMASDITKVAGIAGVSLFDPVLAEIICKWFLPVREGYTAKVCDPFAGGMFGYVCAALGNDYTGIELRPEQAKLNNSRVEGMSARYVCDDGRNIGQHVPPESVDMVFSCPPYCDLEKDSDLPGDASNQTWEGFCDILNTALGNAMKCLKPNRFAVIVMSNVRDKKGFYLDICEEIKRTMERGGARVYNEIILLNAVGTAALRCQMGFKNRKVMRVHQEVLVFYKGNPKAIQEEFPMIDYSEQEETSNEE